MRVASYTVDVEVDLDEVLAEADDRELIDELVERGYTVLGQDDVEGELTDNAYAWMLTDEEVDLLCTCIMHNNPAIGTPEMFLYEKLRNR